MSNYLQEIIEAYEQDIRGNIYTLTLDNGDILSFEITKNNVPHLLGIGKLALRQVKGKYPAELYTMLKNGSITLEQITNSPNHKEIYKKIMNFHYLVSILHCGDMVKIVKKRGSLNSSYLLYLDHRPNQIIHLGLAENGGGKWYPESFLILNRNVTAYIDNQLPVGIIDMKVSLRHNPN